MVRVHEFLSAKNISPFDERPTEVPWPCLPHVVRKAQDWSNNDWCSWFPVSAECYEEEGSVSYKTLWKEVRWYRWSRLCQMSPLRNKWKWRMRKKKNPSWDFLVLWKVVSWLHNDKETSTWREYVPQGGGEGTAWLWRKGRLQDGEKHRGYHLLLWVSLKQGSPQRIKLWLLHHGEQGVTKGAETLRNGKSRGYWGTYQEETLNLKVSFQENTCPCPLSFQSYYLGQQKWD